MSTPPTVPSARKPLTWYQHVWIALPFVLVFLGGAVGGAVGGVAWAVNKAVFEKTQAPLLRYVLTGLISAAAVVLYFVVAVFFLTLLRS